MEMETTQLPDSSDSPNDGGEEDTAAEDVEMSALTGDKTIRVARNGRSAATFDDGAPPFEAHSSLRIPTSTVHFRGSLLRIIDTDNDQIVIEQQQHKNKSSNDHDEKDKKIIAKRFSPATYPQRALRLGYTLITVLFVGFLFAFCFQVLLFLFIALPVDSGYTSDSSEVDGVSVVSTLFSFPLMMHGMASLMAMGSAFVFDTYNGAALFRSTVVEIIYMWYVICCYHYVLSSMASPTHTCAKLSEL
jgi:hypothetical protein